LSTTYWHPTAHRAGKHTVVQALQLISQQHTFKEIAHLLCISEKTVENHRSNIMKKLNLPAEKNALLA
jgi:DNA-binding CsgD family transcriptional regulator